VGGCTAPEPVPEKVPESAIPPAAGEPSPTLLIPALNRDQAPESFRVRLVTTKGEILLDITRKAAPLGADRFYNLVRIGFFQDSAFFRTVPGFIAQFGVHGDPAIQKVWAEAQIADDPVQLSNRRGAIAFAQEGPGTRTTQLFINLRDNVELDASGFAPLGRVTEGMEVADTLYSGYGELYPKGIGPRTNALGTLGNVYLKRQFPELDYILRAELVQ